MAYTYSASSVQVENLESPRLGLESQELGQMTSRHHLFGLEMDCLRLRTWPE